MCCGKKAFCRLCIQCEDIGVRYTQSKHKMDMKNHWENTSLPKNIKKYIIESKLTFDFDISMLCELTGLRHRPKTQAMQSKYEVDKALRRYRHMEMF